MSTRIAFCRVPDRSVLEGYALPKNDWTTAVGEVGHGVVNVRGYPIAEIIERLSYADAVFLTIRGELPSASQRRLMDAALCSILEHGFYAPTTVAARVVASASPQSIIPGLTAGALTIGSITVSPQHSAELIAEVLRLTAAGQAADLAAREVAEGIVQRGERMPGLGHPLHPEGDPRAEALAAVARETGHWTQISESFMAVRDAYLDITERKLPVNIDGMLGCVLSELGFRSVEMPGIAAISFLPGVIAHCVEEITSPPTLRIAEGEYVGPPPRHLDRPRLSW
ncbi:MAG TPA: citrate/2-methylcitrate synthase [Streptosporangiaceae bacterium]|jgi:citrate synthase